MLVRVDVFGVAGAGIGRAFLRMGADRIRLRTMSPKPSFWKLLGTGTGETFTTRDADPRHWALLTTWPRDEDARAFGEARVLVGWRRFAHEHACVLMEPLASHGTWAGREPFTPMPAEQARAWQGPVAAITRARIRARQTRAFWRSVPPVSADLHADPGLIAAIGIGEAPMGLQGTFSLWRSASAIRAFAYERPQHQEVIRRTAERQWYAEELFARFAVHEASGLLRGAPLLP